MTQMNTRQGKNLRESAVYTSVNEHFETIFNAVLFHSAAFSLGCAKELTK